MFGTDLIQTLVDITFKLNTKYSTGGKKDKNKTKIGMINVQLFDNQFSAIGIAA